LDDLRSAKLLLEYPGLTARIANLIGRPIEEGFRLLPSGWKDKVGDATKAALIKGLNFAVLTMGDKEQRRSRELLHKLLVTATGAGGGALGLASLPVELPISTCLVLRSIADIARSEGHDIARLEVKLSCLEVLALGGNSRKDDTSDNGYWFVRATLAKAISEAASYISEKGIAEEGAPPLVRLIIKISSRFGVIVSEEIAAKAVPVAGAVAGALINLLFMDHFQDMARGHFIIKRLEKTYGIDNVQRKYSELEV
jgi:hypothetical protein